MHGLTAIAIALVLAAPRGDDDIGAAVERLATCKSISAPVCTSAASTLSNAEDAALGPIRKALPRMRLPGQVLAVSVMGSNRSAKATRTLVHIFSDGELSVPVRTIALDLMIERHTKKVTRALIAASEDRDAAIRAAVVRVLGNRPHEGNKKVMKALIRATRDAEAAVRLEAVIGLGLSGGGRSGPVLAACLSDTSLDVRRAAAKGLRRVGCDEAIGPLIEALKDPDAELRQDAVNALVAHTGQNFGEDHAAWRAWYERRAGRDGR